MLLGSSLVALAEPAPVPKQELLPRFPELFWALLLLGGVVLAGIVWAGAVRRDIRRQTTAIQQREAALEAYYRDLFENAHDIIFSLDLHGNLLSLNRAGEQILGFSRQESSRLNFIELVSPPDQERLRGILQGLEGGVGAGHCELELSAKDGRQVALRINLRRQELPGKKAHLQGVAWDVTERKRAEEALRESEQRLRHSLEERVRIGRDLHDGIIQSIYAVGLGLGDCRRMVKDDPAETEKRMERSIADLNAVIREVRTFIVDLEPEALKGREFRTVLEAVAESLRGTGNHRISIEVDPQAANRLSAKQTAHLLQVAREAISNSLRHGRGSTTTAALKWTRGGVCLEVRDDGTGFNPGASPTTGLGLRNIEARAHDLGARSEIVSAPSQGTTVRVEIPEIQLCEPT